jgi:hypothetical protein
MNTKITLYLNEGEDHFRGYQPGHVVFEAFSFELPGLHVPADVAEYAFHITNMPGEADGGAQALVEAYRAGFNRSLSVGDVVRVANDGGTVWLALAGAGFDPLSSEPQTAPLVRCPAHIVRGTREDICRAILTVDGACPFADEHPGEAQ